MRGAPPVRLQVGIDWPWAVLVGLLAMAAGAMALAWALAWWPAVGTRADAPAAAVLLGLTALAWVLAAWVFVDVVRAARRTHWPLEWTGSGWLMAGTEAETSAETRAGAQQAGEPAMVACSVRVRLDAGTWLLLQLQPLAGQPTADGAPRLGRSRWAALHGALHDAARWHLLRCALHGHQPRSAERPDAVPGSEARRGP